MKKYISSDIKDLLTEESKQYIQEDMISDICYVIQRKNVKKMILEYGKITLEIEKMEKGGINMQLTVDGRDIEVIPK